ncbi:unnamed protein product, partial [Candidula unifasciata]
RLKRNGLNTNVVNNGPEIPCYHCVAHAMSFVLHVTCSLCHGFFMSCLLHVMCASCALHLMSASCHAKEGENLVTLPGTTATAVLRAGTKNVLDVTYDKMFGDTAFELPRINYAFNGQKYRYAYGSVLTQDSNLYPQLMKVDVQERQMYEWKCEETHVVGEPVFIAAPEAKKEDDGVVLCPILANTTKDSSFLLVLDASSFTEIAKASTPADLKMNVTFHGIFVNKVF